MKKFKSSKAENCSIVSLLPGDCFGYITNFLDDQKTIFSLLITCHHFKSIFDNPIYNTCENVLYLIDLKYLESVMVNVSCDYPYVQHIKVLFDPIIKNRDDKDEEKKGKRIVKVSDLKRHIKNGRKLINCLKKIKSILIEGKFGRDFILERIIEENEVNECRLIVKTMKTLKTLKMTYYWSFHMFQHMFIGYFKLFPQLALFAAHQSKNNQPRLDDNHYLDISKIPTFTTLTLYGINVNPVSLLNFYNLKQILLGNYGFIGVEEIRIKSHYIVNLKNLEVLGLIGSYTIDSECLIHLPNLKNLYFICSLISVQIKLLPCHFINLKKLETISLYKCFIFDVDSLIYLKSLKKLVLNCSNNLHSKFHLIPKDVEEIEIHYEMLGGFGGGNYDRLYSIKSNYFSHLKRLKSLNLSYGRINITGIDLNQLHLKIVSLRNVRLNIKNFDIESLIELKLTLCSFVAEERTNCFGCENLKKLEIKNCEFYTFEDEISTIREDIFDNLNMLEDLSLIGLPSLKSICLKRLRKLKTFRIENMNNDFISKEAVKYLNMNSDLQEILIFCLDCFNTLTSKITKNIKLMNWNDLELNIDENTENIYDEVERKRKLKLFSFLLSFVYEDNHPAGFRCKTCQNRFFPPPI